MKHHLTLICGLLAAALVFSCTEKPVIPDTPEDPGNEEVKPEPEPEPEPEIKPLLDIKFNSDGSASDASENNFRINTYEGYSLMTWENGSHDGRMARFTHTAGYDISDSYYKFDYYSEKKFRNKMEDGYSIEALVMLDAVPDGVNEIKVFSSTEQGGTGIMVADADHGRQLTFITNVSTNGSSNWVWGSTGVVPERGRYYHIIGVWDKENNEARVYVDGELKNTVRTNGAFNFPKSQACYWFGIGGDPAPSSVRNGWRGDVAIARIYDEPLTTEWVQQHYSNIGAGIPAAQYLPSDVIYMTICDVTAGGSFTIAGSGFESNDTMEISSIDGSYVVSCRCTASESHIVADLPKDITDGKYKLFMRRDAHIYPVGITKLTVKDEVAQMKKPMVIAHRGFHTTGAAENSIEALAKAQEMKFYGSEVDVWITTDGVVVCNHDGILSGMKIQDCTYDQVKNLKLTNGEYLPTFEAMLDQLASSDDTRLILEFKSHSTTERDNAAIDTCLETIERKNAAAMIDYIAADYNICKRLATLVPRAEIGYLNGDRSPSQLYADGINCIDYSYGKLNSNPNWIKEAHDLGMKVNVWTINSDNDMMYWMGKGVDFITTDHPDRLQKIIDAFCTE